MLIRTKFYGNSLFNRSIRTQVILNHKTGSKCPVCKSKRCPLVFDHIYPKSRGGSNKPINLRLICQKCNTVKSDRIISNKYLKKLLKVVEDD